MTDPTTPTTETASVKVRMSPLLMERWTSRDIDGNRVTVAWGETDADGFHEPVFTVHYNDNIAERAAASALSALRAEVEGMGDPWAQSDGRPDKVSVARVLAAIDRIAKADPGGRVPVSARRSGRRRLPKVR